MPLAAPGLGNSTGEVGHTCYRPDSLFESGNQRLIDGCQVSAMSMGQHNLHWRVCDD